ncbi:MAG: TonB-dependent receptor [Flavobacteriales bacterium]|nr:TonB-dependent receptor [Flavobacteriales bacterium]
MPSKFYLFFILIALFTCPRARAQVGEIRGFVYDKQSGEPISWSTIVIRENRRGTLSDDNGFFTFPNVSPGSYTLECTMVGFDTVAVSVTMKSQGLVNQNFYLSTTSALLDQAVVTAARQKRQTETTVGEINITAREIKQIPTVGGAPDLVQYLQILPGVVFSGDQGGQLYIRGGSPVMNKVLLDGMTIYNPFHSIGLFSVFDTDIIKTVDVHSAGFSAEYGGRISAIVDVRTRDGNRTHLSGRANINPFSSKVMLEGPLKKYKPKSGSSSFILSYKNSYLDKSSAVFYPYIGSEKLPYSFGDLYGKLSFNSSSGSYFKLFGFNFTDNVNFEEARYAWTSNGIGSKFLLVPGGSKTLIDGFFAFSDYAIEQDEQNQEPRSSSINGFNIGLNFSYFKKTDEFKYGMELNGFTTDFRIVNANNRKISQLENTTELTGYLNYSKIINEKLILEPGFRIQYYSSLANTSYEPRFRAKYLISNRLRAKVAGGYYSQNLLSAVSDRDVVNLFYGFLSGPDDLPEYLGDQRVTHRMQTARHAVGGLEFDLNRHSEINSEVYIKDFTQVSNINRDKIFDDNTENSSKPEYLRKDFIVEEGQAYGFDVNYKYQNKVFYCWLVYSYNVVNRFDGIRKYQPHFDRRHNFNVVSTYQFGKEKQWEFNGRWNFGSGFPFTLTQGFYENVDFNQGASTDYLSANGDFSIMFADLNTGRLPSYHRLDLSLKRTYILKMEGSEPREFVEIVASCTNVYNRDNIFYFDRVSYQRVNQLPVMPALSVSYAF